ncbi:hypothetical protein QQG55_22660 [Brugia pahangi]
MSNPLDDIATRRCFGAHEECARVQWKKAVEGAGNDSDNDDTVNDTNDNEQWNNNCTILQIYIATDSLSQL